MEEHNFFKVDFGPEEIQLYRMTQQRCEAKNISASDYLKDLIKRDLAWGQFARRKKPDVGRKD